MNEFLFILQILKVKIFLSVAKQRNSFFASVKKLFLVSLEKLHSLFVNHKHVPILKSCTVVCDTTFIFIYTWCFSASYIFVSQFPLLHKQGKKSVSEDTRM